MLASFVCGSPIGVLLKVFWLLVQQRKNMCFIKVLIVLIFMSRPSRSLKSSKSLFICLGPADKSLIDDILIRRNFDPGTQH